MKAAQPQLKCELCEYHTHMKKELTKHIKKVHEKASHVQFSCKLCDYKTNIKGNLTKHEKTVHKQK